MEEVTGKLACLVRYEGVLQATFSLWHIDVLPIIKHAVMKENKGGFKQALPIIPHRILEWEQAEPSPFFNVNTAEELEVAERLLKPA